MAGYDCPYCNGAGYGNVVVIRGKDVVKTKERCLVCFGAGTMTNGKPDVDWDVGITDPDPMWKTKWGSDYDTEKAKGEYWR